MYLAKEILIFFTHNRNETRILQFHLNLCFSLAIVMTFVMGSTILRGFSYLFWHFEGLYLRRRDYILGGHASLWYEYHPTLGPKNSCHEFNSTQVMSHRGVKLCSKKSSWAVKGLNYFRKKFMSHAGVFFKNGKVHER